MKKVREFTIKYNSDTAYMFTLKITSSGYSKLYFNNSRDKKRKKYKN